MLEIGKKIDKMAMELKPGQIMLNMKEIMNLAKNMESELSNGRMAPLILVNSIIIIYMGKVFIPGLIIGNMKVNGEQIKCMEKEILHGLMVENMLENMLMIKRKAMANLYGQMDDAIGVNG